MSSLFRGRTYSSCTTKRGHSCPDELSLYGDSCQNCIILACDRLPTYRYVTTHAKSASLLWPISVKTMMHFCYHSSYSDNPSRFPVRKESTFGSASHIAIINRPPISYDGLGIQHASRQFLRCFLHRLQSYSCRVCSPVCNTAFHL